VAKQLLPEITRKVLLRCSDTTQRSIHFPSGCASAGFEVSDERMSFVYQKLHLGTALEFFPDNVHQSITRLLEKSSLYPVTFVNFIEAYVLIYNGCKEKGIELTFN